MKLFIYSFLFIAMSSISAQNTTIQPTISVSGEGVVKIVPDKALINVRVEHTGKTVSEVKQQTDDAIDAVIKLCRTLGIKANHVTTKRINLNKNYDYKTKSYNYISNQSLSIELIDLDVYEALIQGLLDSGINRIDNISFQSSNQDKLVSQARIKAIKNAKSKALEYATAIDQTVGKAIVISEFSASDNIQIPFMRTENMAKQSAITYDMETIAIGELEIRAKVSVVFELN